MRKTSENDKLRLQHMLVEAKIARQFVEGQTRQSLDDDLNSQYALARAVEVVCEAACNITAEFQSAHHKIDWKQIMGMRQWLVHAYFRVDMNVLWKTTQENLPPLIV